VNIVVTESDQRVPLHRTNGGTWSTTRDNGNVYLALEEGYIVFVSNYPFPFLVPKEGTDVLVTLLPVGSTLRFTQDSTDLKDTSVVVVVKQPAGDALRRYV
jgi:hypothetical protein